jgi:hypothetical protein
MLEHSATEISMLPLWAGPDSLHRAVGAAVRRLR